MNTVIIILFVVMNTLLWFLADWYKEEASRERTAKRLLQDDNATAIKILLECATDIDRQDSSYIDKEKVIIRIQDAAIVLGHACPTYNRTRATPSGG